MPPHMNPKTPPGVSKILVIPDIRIWTYEFILKLFFDHSRPVYKGWNDIFFCGFVRINGLPTPKIPKKWSFLALWDSKLIDFRLWRLKTAFKEILNFYGWYIIDCLSWDMFLNPLSHRGFIVLGSVRLFLLLSFFYLLLSAHFAPRVRDRLVWNFHWSFVWGPQRK